MPRQKDGFKGERSLVMPKMITDILEKDAFCKYLYVTDIGFYPHAVNHFRERKTPINEFILLYCIDGKGWYNLNGVKREISTNQFVIIPANVPHSYGAAHLEPWSIYWMHFKGIMADDVAKGLSVPRNIDVASNSRINDRLALFEEIFHTLKSGFEIEKLHYAHSALHHFFGSIRCVNVYRNAVGTKSNIEVDTANNNETVVAMILKYMKENISRHITLQEFSDYSGYTPTYFSFIFKKVVGHAPLSYFNLLKIQSACKMLDTTGMKISQISARLGFEDSLYFTRLFSKIMGMSPKEYRAIQRG